MTWARLKAAFACALVLLALAVAQAATVTIDAGDDPDARLEVRRIRLPSGLDVELVVLSGKRIVVRVDENEIVGERLEIDLTNQVVRIIGPGSFTVGTERLEGSDLEIDIATESARAISAIVFTSAIDVSGDLAERLPGQLTFRNGLASPCTRCDQQVPDYAFRADRMVLYPGDRLVGYGVDVLIRDRAIFRLPLLVIPLAQGDRQPQLVISTGTADEAAEVLLRWPYVMGRSGIGTFAVRYLADVDPSADAGVVGRLLGGTVLQSYVGFTLAHRFYDELGSGLLDVDLDPARAARDAAPGLRERAAREQRFTVRFAYEREQSGTDPALRIEVGREDARVPGRWLYALELDREIPEALSGVGVRARFDTQGFVDTDEDVGGRTAPSYAGRATPWRTGVRFRVDALEPNEVRIGSLVLRDAQVDLGFFEDLANPINRRAAALGVPGEARALLGTELVLEPTGLWSGARLSGDNRFEGRYYGSGERAVSWRTRLNLEQGFGAFGSVSVAFARQIEEGETPFRFDAAIPRASADVRLRVALRPFAWLAFEQEGGYVLVENRRPEAVGFTPLRTRVDLLGNFTWVNLSFEHVWPIAEERWGTLSTVLALEGRDREARVNVTLSHVQDLDPLSPDRDLATETKVAWAAVVERVAGLEITGAYRPAGDDALGEFDPLVATLRLGSQEAGDARPGLTTKLGYDLVDGEFDTLEIAARAQLGPFEISALEEVSLVKREVTDARVAVDWRDVGRVELRGLIWLPLGLVGAEPPEPRARNFSVQAREFGEAREARWEATFSTTFDPALADGGRRNSRFEVRLRLLEETIGPWLLSVEATSDLALADAALPRTYLRRASLVFGADGDGRWGLQGRVGYQAIYDANTDALRRSELTISDLIVTWQATDELLVGGRIQDVWEFTGSDPNRSPWNLQPEVFFVWNRCCWALSGAWDSATGSVRILLTGPGGSGGLDQVIDTPLTLPRTPVRGDEGNP